MLVDRVFRLTFRNFSTLFLLAAVFFLPLQTIYALWFRDVIAVWHLHEGILGGAPVVGVAPEDVTAAGTAAWVVVALEAALLAPLAVAARRVFEVDRSGGVPGVWDSLAKGRRTPSPESLGAGGPSLLLGAVVVALGVAAVGSWIVAVLLGLVPDGFRFVALALLRTATHSLAAPFPMGALALGVASR